MQKLKPVDVWAISLKYVGTPRISLSYNPSKQTYARAEMKR